MVEINSTQVAGLVSFLPAAVAAVTAARLMGPSRTRQRNRWATIATIYILAAVEVVAKMRHGASATLGNALRVAGLYPERRPFQVVVLLIILTGTGIVAAKIASLAPTWQLSLACAASATLVLLFIVEFVSLHATDAVLYHPVGPILFVGWLWLACGWSVVAACIARS